MPQRKFQNPRLRKASNLPYDVFLGKPREATVHGDAQSLTRHYDIGAGAMFKISINLRKMGVAEEQVLATERLVQEEILKPFKNDLAAEIARLEQRCAGEELVQSTKPVTLTFQIQFPDANDLLDLLLDYNRFLVLIHTLWHARKLPNPDYVRLTEQYRNRLKEGEKRIDRIAREAIKVASEQERKQKEDAEVEAGIEAMAADAASPGSQESAAKTAGRRGRKAAETATEPEKPKEDQEKGVETSPVMESTEGDKAETFSPFEMQ